MKKFLKHISYGSIIFVLINLIIAFKYEYPAYKAIKNKTHKNYLKWNSIHSNKNAYDLIVLGSSRSYTGFNPQLIDKGLNLNSFNMGTSAQDIAESYYTLLEILDYQNPKYVVLETYLDLSDNTHDFYQIFSNSSFFNSTKNKYNLITKGYGTKGIGNFLFPLMKFNNYIKQDLKSLIYERNKKPPKKIWYKGFYRDTVIVSEKKINEFKPIPNFNNKSFNEKRFEKYLTKIYELTESNNIQLFVIRSPYPPTRLKLDNNKDEENYYKNYFKNYNDVGYYDLNNYKQDVFKYEDIDFSDFHHVNYKGATKMSNQIIDIVSNNHQ
ncbi:DUF1574 domain-containing protein [Winogradskyella vincentii]|uniref:DUF1574 domain-containing protein n=1 Tax=Winogradskyella vincentii TaxID=2877122 RepID=A0ABS7Y0Z2_9FLAO|nr:DUF1574 domain-containing protein [Winogradskyella vincentii]MCA0153005.1 DUF1574 domain-containing protein [Winogradskyella vincentii]